MKSTNHAGTDHSEIFPCLDASKKFTNLDERKDSDRVETKAPSTQPIGFERFWSSDLYLI